MLPVMWLACPSTAIGPRVLVSALFFLGLVYFGAIMKRLQGYGQVNEATEGTEAAAREMRYTNKEGRNGMVCREGDGEKEQDGEKPRKTTR